MSEEIDKTHDAVVACPFCGSNELYYQRKLILHKYRRLSLKCVCGWAKGSIWSQSLSERQCWLSEGAVTAGGRIKFNASSVASVEVEPIKDVETGCRLCNEGFDPVRVSGRLTDTLQLPSEETWSVGCDGNCGKELEFGFTEPGRKGLLKVLGVHDFDPREVYPEARFVKDWADRGWCTKAGVPVAKPDDGGTD